MIGIVSILAIGNYPPLDLAPPLYKSVELGFLSISIPTHTGPWILIKITQSRGFM